MSTQPNQADKLTPSGTASSAGYAGQRRRDGCGIWGNEGMKFKPAGGDEFLGLINTKQAKGTLPFDLQVLSTNLKSSNISL